MRITLAALALTLSTSALARAPEEVAREVLEAQNRGDTATANKNTLARCQDQPVAHILPIQVLGAPATLDQLTLTPVSAEGDQARVSYAARGHIEAQDHQAELSLFGVKTEVHVDTLEVEDVSVEGTLELVRSRGRWLVSCPEG